MRDQFDLSVNSTVKDVRGMAYATSTKTLYIADDQTNSILGTALPENTGVEVTTVGSYGSQLQVVTDSLSVQSPQLAYSVVRNPEVAVEVTAPSNNFILTGSTTTISGRVNDPSVTQVTVGIQLPFTRFVDDQAIAGQSEALWTLGSGGGSAVWHVACSNASPGLRVSRRPRGPSRPRARGAIPCLTAAASTPVRGRMATSPQSISSR